MTATEVSELAVGWTDHDPRFCWHRPGRWGVRLVGSEAAAQLGRHLQAYEYEPDLISQTLTRIDDLEAGRFRPGWFGSDPDGATAYGNGYVLVASGYAEEDQVLVTLDVFRMAFRWLWDLVSHPDFTNPAGRFEPLVVPVLAHGPGAEERYTELGGSFFNELYD